MSRPGTRANSSRPVLITGGCGFIGTNLAHRLATSGHQVVLFDSLARPGVEQNLRWLHDTHGSRIEPVIADIRDTAALREVVERASQIFHFAAQVAVTTSLVDPIEDFEINVGGALNLLEAVRALPEPPPVVFTSTNKVYGALQDVDLWQRQQRYEPANGSLRRSGVNESRPLDFHSPYGCSKGAADQYVLDYARTYGLATVVFRMSCIYGLHQFGTEDQGWVAHFLIRALEGLPITLYGDGHQVRDILAVEDLIDALLLAQKHMDSIRGQPFNIGGGPTNAVSLLELLELIGELLGHRPEVDFDSWRTGDQRYYVSDTGKFERATGWQPRTPVRAGLEQLARWLQQSRSTSRAAVQLAANTPQAGSAGGRP